MTHMRKLGSGGIKEDGTSEVTVEEAPSARRFAGDCYRPPRLPMADRGEDPSS